MVGIIDVYVLHTRICDLSRYGTRERYFYPSNGQAVSLARAQYGTKPVHVRRSRGAYSLCQLVIRTGLLWRCTEAYDHYVDLARRHRCAPLKSAGLDP